MIDIDPAVSEERAVEPLDDDGGHLTDGTPCWCMPRVETLACGAEIVVHRGHEDWS